MQSVAHCVVLVLEGIGEGGEGEGEGGGRKVVCAEPESAGSFGVITKGDSPWFSPKVLRKS